MDERAPGVAGAAPREAAVSVRDTGWVDGERTVGPFMLHAVWDGERHYARVWFDHGDTLIQATPRTSHDTQDAARLSAEAALRRLCLDTLKALGETP